MALLVFLARFVVYCLELFRPHSAPRLRLSQGVEEVVVLGWGTPVDYKELGVIR